MLHRALALVALVLAVSAPAAAQSPAIGAWDVTLNAPGSTDVFDRGRLVIPAPGAQGSFGLTGQGFTGDLVDATITGTAPAFSLAATLSIAGQALPVTIAGTVISYSTSP